MTSPEYMSCTKTADFQHVPEEKEPKYKLIDKDGVMLEGQVHTTRCTECGLFIRSYFIKGEKRYYTLW